MSARGPRVEIVRADSGWFFRVIAGNGKTLCTSELYTRRGKAEHAAALIGGALLWSPTRVFDERSTR